MVFIPLTTATNCTTASGTTDPVLTFIEQLFTFFMNGLFGLLSGFGAWLSSNFGSTIESILGTFSNDISGYGIYAIPMLVLVVAITGAGVYAILVISGGVDDLA